MQVENWLNTDLGRKIWEGKYRYNNETLTEWFDRVSGNDPDVRKLIQEKKFLFGGRTLSNRGLNNGSYSNCYSSGYVEDDLVDIMNVNTKLALTYKAQGGQGVSLSKIRPKGCLIGGRYQSDGIVPIMEMYNKTTESIMQGGSRKGALMLSIDINHKEAETFITIKSDLSKINKANLSVEIDDYFMEIVKLSYESGIEHKINIKRTYGVQEIEYEIIPIKLYKTLIKQAHSNAEPGVLFINKFRNYNLMEFIDSYQIETCNPCQPSWATVLTKDGIRTIGEISVGDKIWSEEGWTNVVNKWSTGVKEVKEFRTTSGIFYGTDNHKLVSRGIKVEAKDCESVDSLAGCIPTIVKHDPNIIMDGLVLGDGTIHKASNDLVLLCIGKDDIDYFDSEIKELIIKHRPGIKEECYEIKTNIQHYELPHTYERTIPIRYYNGDVDIKLSFLRGLYSANGSVVSNRITFKTSSSNLRDQLQIMLSSVGIRSYFTTNKSKDVEFKNGTYTCKESYDINISNDRDKFVRLIGFIQDYKNQKINLNVRLQKPKSYPIIYNNYISTEEVFDITVDNKTHTYWTGGVNVSNCGEQPLPKDGACNLGSQNISEYVLNPFTSKAGFNWDEFKKDVKTCVRGLDSIIDENLENHATNEQRIKAIAYRNIGLGVMGFADALIKMGYIYGDKESVEFTSLLIRTQLISAIEESVNLAKIKGVFPEYKPELFDATILKGLFSKEEIEGFKLIGIRNCSLLSIAPTGSLGSMFNISTGMEPNFAFYFNRKTEALGGVESYHKVFAGIAFDYTNQFNTTDLPEYFVSSHVINWKDRIDMQSAAQQYIDTAISATINLPETITVEEVEKLYLYAWEKGLKGVTIYRDNCREGILTLDKKEEIKSEIFFERPESLDAKVIHFLNDTTPWVAFIGIKQEKPFEIFSGPEDIDLFPIPKSVQVGQIIKTKENNITRYDFRYTDKYGYINTLGGLSRMFNKEYWNYARLLSGMLRNQVSTSSVVEIIDSMHSDSESLHSWKNGVIRALKTFIKDGTKSTQKCSCGGDIIYTGGCKECKECGWSQCS